MVEHLYGTTFNPPFRYSKSPSSIRTMPPLLGQQSAEIQAEVGYSEKDIDTLLAQKVARLADLSAVD